jgi:hypothetical protein
MILYALIKWLEKQDLDCVVEYGFGSPHSDRGNYYNLAFNPVKCTTFRDMLRHARSAYGSTFTGWKGGDFLMNSDTECFIGEYGVCGELITSAHLKLWQLTAKKGRKK